MAQPIDRSRNALDVGKADLLDKAPSEISWSDLASLQKSDPEAAAEISKRIFDVAVKELVSGERAATTISFYFDFGPLARARFLAVREELMAEWNPDSPSASLLIDMLAQLHCAYERWMQRHMSALEIGFTPDRSDEAGHVWKPPRIVDAAALELSGEMVERFHRMCLRTVRQLRELQKNHQPVVVQNAGQVNVGNQQINVHGAEDEGK